MPIRRTPPSWSFPPCRPVTTRSTMNCGVRQVTRSSFAALVHGISAHSHAVLLERRGDPCPGLAHESTPCRGQLARCVSASRKHTRWSL
jgi:hypothetical protein